MSQKKFSTGKFLKIYIFVLEHVLDHSKSIPTKKNFSKNFRFFVPNFSKKRLCPKKNFQREKIFKIDIFVLKYVFDHSKSIPTEKIFESFSIFWSPIFRKNG